jgi:hypothetical protein
VSDIRRPGTRERMQSLAVPSYPQRDPQFVGGDRLPALRV